jgi:glycosyltransferase involved in cell wall biosynthesis
MKIGIDASSAFKKKKTGVEWYSYYLIKELKNYPSFDFEFILYSPIEIKEEFSNFLKVKILKWPFKYFWTQIRLAYENISNPVDVLFVPSHALPIFTRSKTIITLHDLGFERFPQVYPLKQRLYTRFVYKWAVKHASLIIAISEFTKKELINLYKADPNKIEVVYLGYDENLFYPRDENEINNLLSKYKIKRPYLLYVGRLEKKKNIINLIKAFTFFSKDFYLLLIGKPGFGYKEIKKFQSKFKNIIELGYIPYEELPIFYSGATCFIFPSLYEGFGLPILEAMACGCPVVASNSSSIPEIGENAILYFKPENPYEIVKNIFKIIKDEELRKDLKVRGFLRVKNFSWKKTVEKTLEVFKKKI